MSDLTTYPTVQIPRFKDKVMYIPASVSKTKQESSYVISSSFKGIVRMSPNNHNTTYEKADIQLSLQDDAALGTTYSDAIKFDNEAKDAIKSNADITKRMIIGSDSDGYLVNFRFSEYNLEFDDLGVIGITEATNMTIYTSATTDISNILTINGERMPYFPQTGSTSLPLYRGTHEGQLTNPVPAHEWDVRDVKITGEPDNSYVVYGTIDNNNKRTFKWNQTSKFIKELILEALLDLQTIPTGSIHWFPVTLSQYKELVINNGSKPNTSFINGDDTQPVDPLLRDFLLCDGRRYNNRDFPELAKILWKEPISRWKIATNDNTKMYPFFDVECNNYGPKQNNGNIEVSTNSFTFRVPDLRHMFISSIYMDGTTSVASGKAEEPMTSSSTPNAKITGSRCPDNKPSSQYGTEEDKHFHFISYGSYSRFKKHSVAEGATCHKVLTDNEEANSVNDYIPLKNEAITYTFYLTNHNSYEYNNSYFEGFHYRTSSTADRWVYGVDAIPCTMILCTPGVNPPNTGQTFSKNKDDYKQTIKQSFVTKGGTSESVPSLAKPSKYEDINDKFSGSQLSTAKENYVPWGSYMTKTYGHENTPKFYCMLPFIKI